MLIDVLVASPDGGRAGFGETYRALIDTGATRTTVSDRIIHLHQLPLRGKMLIRSATTDAARRRAYGFKLGVFCRLSDAGDAPVSPFGLDADFAAPPFMGNEAFDVLIGMDLLSQGRLVIDRQAFSFAF